jgi:hypothetical protein
MFMIHQLKSSSIYCNRRESYICTPHSPFTADAAAAAAAAAAVLPVG